MSQLKGFSTIYRPLLVQNVKVTRIIEDKSMSNNPLLLFNSHTKTYSTTFVKIYMQLPLPFALQVPDINLTFYTYLVPCLAKIEF